MENLEIILGLCIGLSGFIISVLLYTLTQKNSKVFFTLMGAFAFLAISSIAFLFYRDIGLFDKYDSRAICLLLTAIYTAVLICVFAGLLYLYMNLQEKYKVYRMAASLNISVEEYKIWRKNKLKEIADRIKD